MTSPEYEAGKTAMGVIDTHGFVPALRTAVFRISAIGAAVALAAIGFSTVYEILLRIFAGYSTRWVNEYTTYFLAATAFLGFAATELKGSNIRVTVIYDQVGETWRHRLETLARWVPVVVVLLVSWRLLHYWHEEYVSNRLAFGLMTTRLWVPQSVMLAGAALWLVAVLLRAAELTDGKRPNWAWPAGIAVTLLVSAVLIADGIGLYRFAPLNMIALVTLATLLISALWQRPRAAIILAGFFLPIILVLYLVSGGGTPLVGTVMLLLLLTMLFSSIPVGYGLSAVGLFAIALLMNPRMVSVIGDRSWHPVASFELTAVPMFVLMGALLVRSNASAGLFSAMRIAFGRVRGASAMATVMAAGCFSAVCGSSLATAATLGNIAGREMTDQGYSTRLTYGVIAAGGTLGILIPPSLALIIYGSVAGVPVTALFLAAILPGLMMIVFFLIIVALWCVLSPDSVPTERPYPFSEKLRSSVQMVPFIGLFVLLVASLALGYATPTEGGAVGVAGALLICLMNRRLDREVVLGSLMETVFVTGFILLIVIGASHMGFAIDFLRITSDFARWIQTIEMNSFMFFVGIVIFYIILGLFLDSLSMILMTLPLVLPLIEVFGWDLIWFGVILVMLVEVGLITPPVGMILFILQGIAGRGTSLMTISAGALPFVLSFIVAVFLLYFVPEIATVFVR